jgi:nitroreductase
MLDLEPVAAEALRRRYGEAPDWRPAEWNAVLESLLSHRSIRAYLPDALPPGTLETAIAAAQSAASSSNLQVWSVVAVEDPERKARLSVLARDQAHIRQAPLFLVWLADLARLRGIAESRGETSDGLDYLEMLLVGVIDAALAAQNAVATFESLGLGTVYIGAIRNRVTEVARELALPPLVMPVFGLCVGYPDPASPALVKPRLAQAAVLHRETYAVAPQQGAIEAYGPHLAEFFRAQGQDHPDWRAIVTARIRNAKSLSGRDQLRAALESLGFSLR